LLEMSPSGRVHGLHVKTRPASFARRAPFRARSKPFKA
jgi:hypothetical protein